MAKISAWLPVLRSPASFLLGFLLAIPALCAALADSAVTALGRTKKFAIFLALFLAPAWLVFYLGEFGAWPIWIFGGLFVLAASMSFFVVRNTLSGIERELDILRWSRPGDDERDRQRAPMWNRMMGRGPEYYTSAARLKRTEDRLWGDEGGILEPAATFFLLSTLMFYSAVLFWARHDPHILTGEPATPVNIALFVLDLMLRGGLFDYMEHFELRVGDLRTNRNAWWFSLFAFAYRVYIPLFLIASAMRIWGVVRRLRVTRRMLARMEQGKDASRPS